MCIIQPPGIDLIMIIGYKKVATVHPCEGKNAALELMYLDCKNMQKHVNTRNLTCKERNQNASEIIQCVCPSRSLSLSRSLKQYLYYIIYTYIIDTFVV